MREVFEKIVGQEELRREYEGRRIVIGIYQKKVIGRRTTTVVNGNDDGGATSSRQRGMFADPQHFGGASSSADGDTDSGAAGYRVMLYGYSSDKSYAAKILRRVAGLDELRAENAMRSAHSFGVGVVDEFYVAESGSRERAVRAARKSADELGGRLKEEGMMVEVEPLNLLK